MYSPVGEAGDSNNRSGLVKLFKSMKEGRFLLGQTLVNPIK